MDEERNEALSRRIWWIGLILTSLPVAFCLWQIWIFFDEAFPHLYFSRTLPALVAVGFGIAGIAIPIWLIWRRRKFGAQPVRRQGLVPAVQLTITTSIWSEAGSWHALT